jgi:uncharacterized protein YheU (UPF0270 family)
MREHEYENKNEEALQPSVAVPAEALSDAALQGVIEEFILRYGTDYGANEVPHDTKIEQVRKQISKGDIKVVFDPNTESVTLMTSAEWTKLQS